MLSNVESAWRISRKEDCGGPSASAPFILRAHPKGNSITTVQCTVLRSGGFMSSSSYEVWLDDPRRLLMVARKIDGFYHFFDVARVSRSLTPTELSALTKTSVECVGRLSAYDAAEFILCTDEVEMLAAKFDHAVGHSIPRHATVCIPAVLDSNLVPIAIEAAAPLYSTSMFGTLINPFAENSMLKLLRDGGGASSSVMWLATKQPTFNNGSYRLSFVGGRVLMVCDLFFHSVVVL